MEMKEIKIKFIDMWSGFEPESSLIFSLLRKRYKVVLSDNPDYVICSVYGEEYLKYDCIRIFWTGECLTPDFNLYDYAVAFDFLEFGDRYFRMPLFNFCGEEKINLAEDKVKFTASDLKKKKQFANFVYSNGGADVYRENLFDALSKYKPVVSGGKYRNNVRGGAPVKDKMGLLRRCKFTIACENSYYPGYTTEKILDAFAAHTIPIYWGNPLIEMDFNGKAFINCHKFDSIDEVVAEIRRIDLDDQLYMSMMKEQTFQPGVVGERMELFGEFLYNIFDQDISKAKRRNEGCFGKSYERLRYIEITLWKVYKRYFAIIVKILRCIWRKLGINQNFDLYLLKVLNKSK